MSQTAVGHAPDPFETPMRRIGRRLLNLAKPIVDLDPEELSRAINVRCLYGGPLEVRPGETALGTTTGTDNVHSLFRLNDPANAAFARLAGSASALYRGTTGAFTSVDTGYSGDPLTFCGVTLPLTGLPFVFIGDRSRNRKIDRTNAVQTIGLANGALTSTALGAQLNISVAQFQASDSTAAASWTMTAGTDTAGTASGAPTAADTGPVGDKGVAFTMAPGGAKPGLGYSSIVSIAKSMNLSAFAGPVTVDDEDMIAFDVLLSNPERVLSYAVYFVVSAFTAGVIPGTALSQNTDAYGKTFSGTEIDLLRYWGNAGFPLRRGDFARFGTDPAATWATVTGIIIQIQTTTNLATTLTFNGMYVEGGSGPDTSDVTDRPYDYRVRNFNPVTGSVGNPSAIQAETSWVSPIRQPVTVTPTASGTAALRQQVFRRGGPATTSGDWFYVGVNTSDGGVFSDTVSNDVALTAETLEIDNDQPVTSVNSSGVTVYNQTIPVFFLVEDYCFALGDTLQPGRLYRSKRSRPENWPAASYTDVCAASEELMNGGMIGSAGFCFSRSRMYAILNNADGTFTTEPTECAEGMVGRWAMAETPYGIAFVSPFGVRLTTGGVPTPLSDEQIGPLFKGQAVNGFNAIDLTTPTALKLEYHDNEVWLTYADTGGARRQLIYNLVDKTWRSYLFGTTVSCAYSEPVQGAAASLLLGSFAAGGIYTHSGFSDLGSGIAYTARTGAQDFGDPALEKLLSQIRVEGEIFTTTLTCQAFLNAEATTVAAQAIGGTAGLRPYNFEPFGTTPQRARTVSVELRGTAPTDNRPYFTVAGVSRQLQPMIIYNEPTPWEELPGGEGYLYGCLITCDTGNVARTIEVEYTLGTGAVTSAATLTITADGRKKLPFSWSAVHAGQVRLRPTGTCLPWLRLKIEWLVQPEPPRIAGWDSYFENHADAYYTGLTLECDTLNVAKSVGVYVDGTLITTLTVTANGRRALHFAFGASATSYGKIFHFVATDANPGLLYSWKWHLVDQPHDITNWDQGYDDLGDPGDKYLTGVLLECDTLNVAKTVQVLLDEAVVETLTVTANGRTTQNFHFASGPYRGKIVRLKPTDSNVGRLWQAKWLWNKEPDRTAGFALLNFDDLGWIGEKYVSGVLLECDTSNQVKTVQVEIDGSVAETLTVQANGRRTLQFHFAGGPYSTARVLRLKPTDTNPGQLWGVQWLFENEPVDNAGFGVQNWSVLGIPVDKFIKGVILEVDTANVAKTVLVERDGGTLVATLTVQANGRQVLQFSFPRVSARVLRLRATDTNAGKLYGLQWIFDVEPLALTRWETEEITHGVSGWSKPLEAFITLRSTGTVTLTITAYNASGTALDTSAYAITSTTGAKIKKRVLFNPAKGVLWTYVFTAAAAFTLYREESEVLVEDWISGQAEWKQPFGSDDLDPPRPMGIAPLPPPQPSA